MPGDLSQEYLEKLDRGWRTAYILGLGGLVNNLPTGGIYSVPLPGGAATAVVDSSTTAIDLELSVAAISAQQGGVFFAGSVGTSQIPSFYLAQNGALMRLVGDGDPLDGGEVSSATNFHAGRASLFGNQAAAAIGLFPTNANGALAGIYLFTPSCSIDVSNQITLVRGGFQLNRTTHQYVEQVRILNTGGSPITGPISMAVTGLGSNVFLANATGLNTSTTPGSPLAAVSINSLSPGTTATATLSFINSSQNPIAYNARFFGCR